MDVDPPSSSRLSVLCSTSAEYSSNSSEASSPNSRRSSMNENIIKDESYWERRRKNNDASRRSREKRRLGDLAMEQKLLQLSAENERLKNQLENRASTSGNSLEKSSSSSSIITPALSSALGMPSSSVPSLPLPSMSASVLPPIIPPAQQLPMLQLAQLQAAFQQQYQAAVRPSCLSYSTSSSAFTPFQKDSVIMRPERTSPDSSSDRRAVIRRVPSPASQERQILLQQQQQQHQQQQQQHQQQQQQHPQPSLLGALLSTRRTSPTVPQSRTEHISGLGSPPRSSKSDCESISSSASFSPSHSSEDQMELNDPALRQALGDGDKGVQYIDRRRRNNEAAKRCRANRRAVFEYRSRRVQLLENENEALKEEIDRLKKELEQQRALLSTLTREGL